VNATVTVAKLVWVIGSSIDSNAVTDMCKNMMATINDLDPAMPNHFFWCMFHPSTAVVFTFHPGATPGPYYDMYGPITYTTTDMLTTRAAQIMSTFGKPPDTAVLDSSMWDIANWWQKSGRPQQDWPVPHAEIINWCEVTIPKFLLFAQALLPHTQIVYHSPPPAFATTWKPWTVNIDLIINQMYSCLVSKMNFGLLYAKYHFIDFFKIVQAQHHLAGGQMRALYKDDLHPGTMLSLVYMGEVLSRTPSSYGSLHENDDQARRLNSSSSY